MSYFCENCGKEFDEDYRKSSNRYKKLNPPRFCSFSCCQSFLAKKERKNGTRGPKKGFIPKATGLIYYCKYCSRPSKWSHSNTFHENRCKNNPNKVYGTFYGKHHSDESKVKMSKIAFDGNYGQRLSESTQSKCEYNGIILGSSYEREVAKSLDENNIKWIKPKYLKWESPLDNKEHRYYPDFYLPEYDVYLDPKNDYLIHNKNKYFGIKDTEKISLVERKNNVKVLILDKEHLSWDKIREVLER